MLWDDWTGKVPPNLCMSSLLHNVRSICDEDGILLQTFVESHWATVLRKHAPPGIGIATYLTGWVGDVSKNQFFQFTGSFWGINNDCSSRSFALRVWQGEYDEQNEAICETDRCVDIGLSSQEIQDAIDGICDGSISVKMCN